MAETLSLILRALIFQADHKRGVPFTAELKRGLVLQVTQSLTTENYLLECGRKRKHTDGLELTTVQANWPQKVYPVEWTKIACDLPNEIHWMQAIMKPVEEP
jgi:hypothetical protein